VNGSDVIPVIPPELRPLVPPLDGGALADPPTLKTNPCKMPAG